jgi:hypothetical protein
VKASGSARTLPKCGLVMAHRDRVLVQNLNSVDPVPPREHHLLDSLLFTQSETHQRANILATDLINEPKRNAAALPLD